MKDITLPVSKSLYIRKLICDFLDKDQLGDIPMGVPADIQVVYDALCLVRQAPERLFSLHEPVSIDVHDCGAAYRFLMAVLAITPGQWLLTGTERLLQRPIEELVQCLRSIGADLQWISGDDDMISCRGENNCVSTKDGEMGPHGDAQPCISTNTKQGWLIHGKPLHASDLNIDCHRSGQFASALWLISNKIGLENLHILPENPPSSSYIEMTKAVVNGTEKMEEGRLADWSAAVYWYARLLLEGQMHSSKRSHLSSGTVFDDAPAPYKLLHLDLSSIQSDAVMAHWFADWGIESRQEEDGVAISYNEDLIKPQSVIELDMSQNLDLVPVLACMACLWPKKMIFNGVVNLKYKESDRLQFIQEQLSAFAEIELKAYNGIVDNQLVVNPCRDVPWRVSTTNNGVNSSRDAKFCVSTNDMKSGMDFVFDAHNDHRLVMAFSLFALKCPVFIQGFDSVKKSYPNFHAEGVVAGADVVG